MKLMIVPKLRFQCKRFPTQIPFMRFTASVNLKCTVNNDFLIE